MPEAEVLIFDQDDALSTDLKVFLARTCGWRVEVATSLADLSPVLDAAEAPRLIIVGEALSDGCGLDLIRKAREGGVQSFVLFIDRRTDPDAGADAFAAGADDVARTPFSMREFALRLRRRLGEDFPLNDRGLRGPVPRVMLDARSRLISAGTQAAAQLTPAEADVMKVLIRRGGEIVTRDELSRAIDNCDWVYGDRKFDVHITKIRKKLKTAFGERYVVKTVRAEGYAFYESATPGGTGKN